MMGAPAHGAVRGSELPEVWLPLLVLATLGAAWYHVLRLREFAVAHARRLCEHHGLQLLDDSVSLHRLRARWRHGALRIMREYRFETSRGGDDRRAASITLLHNRIVATSMPPDELAATASVAAATTYVRPTLPRAEPASGNVVPFERGRRSLP